MDTVLQGEHIFRLLCDLLHLCERPRWDGWSKIIPSPFLKDQTEPVKLASDWWNKLNSEAECLKITFTNHSIESLSMAWFGVPWSVYTPDEAKIIFDIFSVAEDLLIGSVNQNTHDHGKLHDLNDQLAQNTTFLGVKPSLADISVYIALLPHVEKWTDSQKTGESGFHHITRFIDFVQSSFMFAWPNLREGLGKFLGQGKHETIHSISLTWPTAPLSLNLDGIHVQIKPREFNKLPRTRKGAPVIVPVLNNGLNEKGNINPSNDTAYSDKVPSKAKIDRKSTAKASQPQACQNIKSTSGTANTSVEPTTDLIDFRVGYIVHAMEHPNADSLYVSQIACGDSADTENVVLHEKSGMYVRTVCSGLRKFMKVDELQGRRVVVVCNLKPVTMRGVKSCAMVLAASTREENDTTPVLELVTPPLSSPIGAPCTFINLQYCLEKSVPSTDETVNMNVIATTHAKPTLPPKKKIWESLSEGFTTDNRYRVVFDLKLLSPKKDEEKTAESIAVQPRILSTADGPCRVNSLVNAIVR